MTQPHHQQSRSQNKGKSGKEHTFDSFRAAIQRIGSIYKFNTRSIIDSFERENIRSSDFSLSRFEAEKEFIINFCRNKCKIKVTYGKLRKLWQELRKRYSIKTPCYTKDLYTIQSIWSENRSLVFISPQSTQAIVHNKLLQESQTIDTAKRLYQYLNWTVRISKMDKFIKCFESRNRVQFMLINSELHDHFGNVLYMFCIENDIVSDKAQKWQFVDLLTAQEIGRLVSVPYAADGILPRGARSSGYNFQHYQNNRLPSKPMIAAAGTNPMCYKQLKGIRTTYDRKNSTKDVPIFLSLAEFYECIEKALQSKDARHDLIPIVSILSGKKYGKGNYSVDQVLPIKIKEDWVGVVYRKKQPVMLLFDAYDITNKAILCDPSFNKQRLSWFRNNITKIIIHASRSHIPYAPSAPNHTMDTMGGESGNEMKQQPQTPQTPQSQQNYMNMNNNNNNGVIGAYSFVNSVNNVYLSSVTEGTSTNGNNTTTAMNNTPSVPANINGFVSAPVTPSANIGNNYQFPVYIVPANANYMYMTPALVPEGFSDITSKIPLPFPGFTAEQLSTIAKNMGIAMVPVSVPITPLIIPQQSGQFQVSLNNQGSKPKVGSF